jgi:serine/threonine transporter
MLGTLFGLLTPQASFLSVLGDLFVGALKGIAPLLVFVLVISSLTNATGGIGKRFTTVIALYLGSTLLAAVIAVVASFLFPMDIKLTTGDIGSTPPGGLLEIFKSILGSIVQNRIVYRHSGIPGVGQGRPEASFVSAPAGIVNTTTEMTPSGREHG